jgi:hypothetical protein
MDEEKSLNTDSPDDKEKSFERDNQGNRADKEKSIEPENQGNEENMENKENMMQNEANLHKAWRNDNALLHDPDDESHQDGEQAYTRNRERFLGLLQETMVKFSNGDYQKEANALVAKGHLLKPQAEFVPRHAIPEGQLQNSWQYFYEYYKFTWRPDLLIPAFKPNCVNCLTKDRVAIHKYSHPPRMVAGLYKNSVLNSPIQWICKACELQYSNDAANNIPVAERKQNTFLSYDPRVLAQLEEEYPGIYRLFPFYLG